MKDQLYHAPGEIIFLKVDSSFCNFLHLITNSDYTDSLIKSMNFNRRKNIYVLYILILQLNWTTGKL